MTQGLWKTLFSAGVLSPEIRDAARTGKREVHMSKSRKSQDFSPNEYVVYPAHGVGQIVSIEEQEIAGLTLELFVISFEKDKMTLRVPTAKATEVGMRSLSRPTSCPRRWTR
jgi:transcription-repair coupling factor (superfamily II helicase)